VIERFAAAFERFVMGALILLLIGTILFGTVAVAWSLTEDLLHASDFVAEPKLLFDVFGLFVAVLVGVELLKILRHVMISHEVDVTLVVETALIALCNKVITLNPSNYQWTTLAAVAGLIVALAAAIYALGRLKGGTQQP
jgi:uncharacterized membrane protein (DUF373 family)